MTSPHPARDHLALALDVDSLDEALAMVRELHPWFGVVKVGLQLFTAAGPVALTAPPRWASMRSWTCSPTSSCTTSRTPSAGRPA